SVKEEILRKLSADVARFYNIVPFREADGVLFVAMADPLNLGVLDDIGQIVGQPVKGAVSNLMAVTAFIQKNYNLDEDTIQETLEGLIAHVGDKELSASE